MAAGGNAEANFIGMLQTPQTGAEIAPSAAADVRRNAGPVNDPVRLCTDVLKTLQMVSDALLLNERSAPLNNQTFNGSHDVIVAKSKTMSMAANRVEQAFRSLRAPTPSSVMQPMAELAEGACSVIEAAAQSLFVLGERSHGCEPGTSPLLDTYTLSRARHAVGLGFSALQGDSLDANTTLAVSAVLATHLDASMAECRSGLERTDDDLVKLQLKTCNKALSGTVSALVTSMKTFARAPTVTNRKAMLAFSKPVLFSFDALYDFAQSSPEFLGKPPQMSEQAELHSKPIRAAALSVFIKASKALLVQGITPPAIERLKTLTLALEDYLAQLSATVRQAKLSGVMKV